MVLQFPDPRRDVFEVRSIGRLKFSCRRSGPAVGAIVWCFPTFTPLTESGILRHYHGQFWQRFTYVLPVSLIVYKPFREDRSWRSRLWQCCQCCRTHSGQPCSYPTHRHERGGSKRTDCPCSSFNVVKVAVTSIIFVVIMRSATHFLRVIKTVSSLLDNSPDTHTSESTGTNSGLCLWLRTGRDLCARRKALLLDHVSLFIPAGKRTVLLAQTVRASLPLLLNSGLRPLSRGTVILGSQCCLQ